MAEEQKAKFSVNAEVIKAISKLYSDIGPVIYITFDGELARFVTIDAGKTTAVVSEIEPTIVMESGSMNATIDSDTLKRIAAVLKNEEVTIEILEDKIVLAAEGDYTKRFEIMISAEEPPRITRETLIERMGDAASVTISPRFFYDALRTMKKTLNPDTLKITIEKERIRFSVPSALNKVEVIGDDIVIEEIHTDEEFSMFYPFEYILFFAKSIHAVAKSITLYMAPSKPLVIDTEAKDYSRIAMMVAPRKIRCFLSRPWLLTSYLLDK